MKNKFSVGTALIYTALLAGAVWQGLLLVRQLRPDLKKVRRSMIDVRVDGNVRKPGWYRIPLGTTEFEILKVAGVRPTSDLSMFSLTQQVDSADNIKVGTLEKAVGLKKEPFTARLEFFFGEVSVIGADGRNVPQHEGLAISQGDRILTEASSQAELSVGAYSRIDLDNFSELTFDKLGEEQDGKAVVEMFQRAGICWYKTVYTKNKELFRINTNSVTVSVGGSGADFLVDVQSDKTVINLMDGLLLVERIGGGEAINMISGQSVTIYNDERPFQVTKLTPDVSVNERFAQLSREKVNYLSRQMPLNFLFCGTPAVYYLISIQFDQSLCSVVRLPGKLLIEQFANGIKTLDQAFLYGGAVMVATFVERVLDIRIPKYIVFDKDDIINIGSAMGGLEANIDPHAASYLNVTRGKRVLAEEMLARYLSPAISGVEDARNRQSAMLHTLFTGLQNRRLVPTLVLADQVIGSTETNFGASEIMNQYSKFTEKTNWKYRELTLPVTAVKRENINCYDPQLEKCKVLLTTYE
jgi:hypothetical protein